MVWPGIKMIQTEYRLVSVGVSVGPAYFPWKTKKESEALSETDGLCSSEHGFGVSVCNGPLSVMQVSWAAPKFKATSYYSVHPLILSATHMVQVSMNAEPFQEVSEHSMRWTSNQPNCLGVLCFPYAFTGYQQSTDTIASWSNIPSPNV